MTDIWQKELMKHAATYWGPIVNNGYGSGTFLAPVEIICRWEDKQEKFTDTQGDERISSAVVYPGVELLAGGWLARGVTAEADPRNVPTSFEIKAYAENPSLDDSLKQVVAWL